MSAVTQAPGKKGLALGFPLIIDNPRCPAYREINTRFRGRGYEMRSLPAHPVLRSSFKQIWFSTWPSSISRSWKQ